MSPSERKLDDAARAAWLSFVAGKKQEEIAALMGISRQSAQRLVSQALAAGLVKVRIDHPIAHCLELALAMKDRYGIAECQVVPSMDTVADSGVAVSFATGDLIEDWLETETPLIIGLGTGRTLRAAVEHMPHLRATQHRVVSLTGNISPDGSTAFYNVLFTIAAKINAATYPLPMPVIAANKAERDALLGQATLDLTRDLAQKTDVRFVGIGSMRNDAPLVLDGFIHPEDQQRLIKKGAVGEIIGWVFDAEGQLLDDEVNDRISSAALMKNPEKPTFACAHGPEKVLAIRAAMRGSLISGLITDERTAMALTK